MNKTTELDQSIIDDIIGKNGVKGIKLDADDIQTCIEGADKVEALRINCAYDEMGDRFDDTLESLLAQNKDYDVQCVLFKINDSKAKQMKMGHMSKILTILAGLGENIDVIWGIGLDDTLKEGYVDILVIISFKQR